MFIHERPASSNEANARPLAKSLPLMIERDLVRDFENEHGIF